MKKYYFYLLPLLLLTACIDEIDLEAEAEEPVFVVDGLLTDVEETQIIYVSTSIALNSQVNIPVSGATIFVEDMDGNSTQFFESTPGAYQAETKAVAGKQYRLLGTLPGGVNISSEFQPVPNPFPIDSVSIVDTLVTFTDESGDQRRLKAIDFYAMGEAPAVSEDLFLRFSNKTVYQVSEIVCSPFANAKTCYIYNDQLPLDISLFTINQTDNPVAYNSFVYRRQIDYPFGEVFALDLRLYSYNKSSYEYWQQLKELFDQSGNLTDSTPARLTGNIETDDGSEVLGQFSVVAKTRKIRIVRNSDFSTSQFPYCGLPGLRPFPLPDACCGCLLLPKATLDKPDYWP